MGEEMLERSLETCEMKDLAASHFGGTNSALNIRTVDNEWSFDLYAAAFAKHMVI